MSIAKSLASVVFSMLFIVFLYLAVTSYATGNLMQKENIKSFIRSQINESIKSETCEESCNNEYHQSCEEYCNNLNNSQLLDSCTNSCLNSPHNIDTKQTCIQSCPSRSNESQYISESIDNLYSNNIIAGTSLDDMTPLLKNNILFIVFSIVFGVAVFFVSEKPFSKTGNNLVWVAISLLSIAVIPALLIGSDVSVVKIISDYIMQSFYMQAYIGIALLAIGIVLIFAGKKKNK